MLHDFSKERCLYELLKTLELRDFRGRLHYIRILGAEAPIWTCLKHKCILWVESRISLLATQSTWTQYQNIVFFSGSAAQRGLWPPRHTRFRNYIRHATVGRTPLDEWSARCEDLYLTTYKTHNRQTFRPRWDWNPRSQQASGRRPTP
jgi:hypothetical protein